MALARGFANGGMGFAAAYLLTVSSPLNLSDTADTLKEVGMVQNMLVLNH